MLVFFIIILSLYFLGFLLFISTIKIEIDTFKLEKNKTTKVKDFKIKLYLVVGKIKWLKIEISKEKLEKSKNVNLKKLIEKVSNLSIINNLKGKDLFKNRSIILESIKSTKIKLERLILNANIGLDNIVILTYLIAILDIILSIHLAKRANSVNNKDYNYIITPYQIKNLYLKLSINCIISIKVTNIIKTIIWHKKSLKKEDLKLQKTYCNIEQIKV